MQEVVSHYFPTNDTSSVQLKLKMSLRVGKKRQLDIRESYHKPKLLGSEEKGDCKQPKIEAENDTVDTETSQQPPNHSNNNAKPPEMSKISFLDVPVKKCIWKHISGENLALQMCPHFYNKVEASALLAECEQQLIYNVGELATVVLFGKRIDIPRKQVAHGDPGLTYTFSGNTVPARPWTPLLTKVRDQISEATGYSFNFVLINRYKDGHDYMGEHKDDERDLVQNYPIASLTLGQARDFVFKHQDSRGKSAKRKIDPVTVQLEHGMLLLMNHPTNSFWYHSLPRRTRALGVRVNMTFRRMEPTHCKPSKELKK